MAVKLHRCRFAWAKGSHPCWAVEQALRDAGVEYTVVAGPVLRGSRTALRKLSGQQFYPVIEFEDGTAYRAESKDMAAKIRAGELGTTAPSA